MFDDTAELFTALDLAFSRWFEVDVENIVSDVLATMWSFCIVVFDPGAIDVVEMVYAEAKELIQALEGVFIIAGDFWSILTGHFRILAEL